MWHIDVQKIYTFRGGGGDRFVELCDSLIFLEARFLGIPFSSIHTMQKTTVGDGGVDTKVDSGSASDPTGWFLDKSIWQYKATEQSSISEAGVRKEVTKSFAKQCIQQGYAYRLCVCDSITAEKKKTWEDALAAEVQAINPAAPAPKVVTADDISRWISRYPSQVLHYFHRELTGQVVDLKTHLLSIRNATPQYVPNPDWAEIQSEIKAHVDFGSTRPDPILLIQGKAGVGKTRMVAETLSSDPQLERLVVYSNDDGNVEAVARHLSSTPDARVVIIADECSLDSRLKISATIDGHMNRIRVVAIDNQAELIDDMGAQFALEKMNEDLVRQILSMNFPAIPDDQRRLYASLSKGFVRLAADLARNHAQMVASGQVSPTTQIQSYYQSRLSNPSERKVVEALALFPNVGFKQNVREQLDFLCSFSGVARNDFEAIANRLHDSPGFIGRGGRFYYVTPEIIAQVAFGFAWRNWIQNDPEAFLSTIPATMVTPFVRRVSEYGRGEDRDRVSGFFRRWAEELRPGQLAARDEVRMLEAIVETNPTSLLPILRAKLEEASGAEVQAISGEWEGGGWGSRRVLVWLLERLAGFKEYFFDCEVGLLKLAVFESETKIANNASATWKELFRIVLSGTEVPFFDRLALLKQRLFSGSQHEAELATYALDEIFNSHGTKTVGPPIVAGRVVPRSWSPKTNKEYWDCLSGGLDLLIECSKQKEFGLEERAMEIGIKYCRSLLNYQKLEQLKQLFSGPLSEDIRVKLGSAIEDFIQFDSEGAEQAGHGNYVKAVFEWHESLKGTDFHGQLVDLIGKDPWDRSIRNQEEAWKIEIGQFADKVVGEPSLLRQELEWLYSGKAKSGGFFGEAIGRRDKDGRYLDEIFDRAVKTGNTSFARGYVLGILDVNPGLASRVNKLLDSAMNLSPPVMYDLSIMSPKLLSSLDRTMQLIDSGKLDIQYLKSFAYGPYELSVVELSRIFSKCIEEGKLGNKGAFAVGEDFLASRIRVKKGISQEVLDINKEVKPLVWDFLEMVAEHVPSGADVGYWWNQCLSSEFKSDPKRAISIAVKALVTDHYTLRDFAKSILSTAAQKYGSLILEEMAPLMFDENTGWHFHIDTFKGIFSGIPVPEFKEWIDQYGVEAARKVARHLPSPHLGANDALEVPEITWYVLEKFENDEKVFNAFVTGRHSLQIYSGDIAATHESEAEVAKKFFSHPLKRVRDWAKYEYESARRHAESWRQEDEELGFEDK